MPRDRATVKLFDERAIAKVVGVLFIVASATAIVGGLLILPVDDADSLAELAGERGRVVTGVVLELLLALAVIGIAAMIFPVLERADEGLAAGYVAVRTLEAVLLTAASISALVAVTLADGGATNAPDAAAGDVVLAVREWTYLVGSTVLLGVGGLVLYGLLRRGALVPGWLAVWGTVGAALIVVLGVLEMYGVDPSVPVAVLLTAPIAVNEMVLAVSLIARGFRRSSPTWDAPSVRRQRNGSEEVPPATPVAAPRRARRPSGRQSLTSARR